MINIQQPNLGGLAALASRGQGNLGIGGLGLQALAQLQQQRQAQMQQQAAMAAIRSRDEQALMASDLGNRQLEAQRYRDAQSANLDQQKLGLLGTELAQKGGQFQDELAFKKQELAQQGQLGQGKLDLENKKLEQEKMQKELAKLLDMDKKKLEEKANIAVYAASSMAQAKTPEQKQSVRNEIVDFLVKEGHIDAKQGRAYKAMPLSQFENEANGQAMILGKTKDLKASLDMRKEDSPGTQRVYGPDGKLLYESIPLNTGSATALEKDIVKLEDMIQQFENIDLSKAPKHLTMGGKIKGFVGGLAASLNVPGTEGLQKFYGEGTKFKTDVDRMFSQYVHQMTGSQFGMQEFERRKAEMINSADDPVAFAAKAESLKQYMTKTLNLKKRLLKDGIYPGTPKFEEAITKEFAPKIKATPEELKILRQTFTDEQLRADGLL